MFFLKDPYLDLMHQYIETDRCIVVPFSLGSVVDISEYTREFCKANKDLWINKELPTFDEEIDYIKKVMKSMGNSERFENFIIQKDTGELIGAVGLDHPDKYSVELSLWIRHSKEPKGYGEEVYRAMMNWVITHTEYTFLRHSVHPHNEIIGRLVLQMGGVLQKNRTEDGKFIFHIRLI